ncbi:hypothetical protein C5167_015007 [Papaver somniferum]|uniref:Uncharacterized protein n=1 Tax=Papaver somniferum TaxID=3469 RepID=A0A4Y7J7W2_PAPSO|nr:hypothetical protein C5167_015007 [Papaver somniferum]
MKNRTVLHESIKENKDVVAPKKKDVVAPSSFSLLGMQELVMLPSIGRYMDGRRHGRPRNDQQTRAYITNKMHIRCLYKLAENQCIDDSDKAQLLLWSDTVKQELERHNSFVEVLERNLRFHTSSFASDQYNLGLYIEKFHVETGFIPYKETALRPPTLKYVEFLLAIDSGLGLYAFLSKMVQKLTSYQHAEVVLDNLCNSLAQEEIGVKI